MKFGESDVSSEQKIIGSAKYTIFETVEEALHDPEHGLGEERLLDILNAQIKTNSMNVLRTNLTKGPTKSVLRMEAMNEIVQEVTAGEHGECVGNKEALEALIGRRILQLELRAKEAAAAAGIGTDDDDD